MILWRRARIAPVLAAVMLAGRPAGAQDSLARPLATREALQDLGRRLAAAHDTAGAARVRARLDAGDFHAGDRIVLRVVAESTLKDTFAVTDGGGLMLPSPVNAEIPLHGVLRIELEPYLTTELARYVERPVVHARALLRVSVQGGVVRPGFYSVPADAVLPDLFMAAGGTVQDAKLRDTKIERDGHALWAGAAMRSALAGGRTLDALLLRDGDEIEVPRKGDDLGGHLRFIWLLISITGGVIGLSRVIH